MVSELINNVYYLQNNGIQKGITFLRFAWVELTLLRQVAVRTDVATAC